MAGELPHSWFHWLSLVEFWHNTNCYSSINMSLFELLYGYPPPLYIPYFPKDSQVTEVNSMLCMREITIQVFKHNLEKLNKEIKMLADKRRIYRTFQIGEWVYVKLQRCRQVSMHQGNQNF